MATCLDLAGATYPDRRDGVDIRPHDGRPLDRDALLWEHEANRAVRTDRWKLVSKGENGRWELYDMEDDRTDLDDRSDDHPHVVEDLGTRWERVAERVGAFPLDGRTHRERLEETSEHLEH